MANPDLLDCVGSILPLSCHNGSILRFGPRSWRRIDASAATDLKLLRVFQCHSNCNTLEVARVRIEGISASALLLVWLAAEP